MTRLLVAVVLSLFAGACSQHPAPTLTPDVALGVRARQVVLAADAALTGIDAVTMARVTMAPTDAGREQAKAEARQIIEPLRTFGMRAKVLAEVLVAYADATDPEVRANRWRDAQAIAQEMQALSALLDTLVEGTTMRTELKTILASMSFALVSMAAVLGVA